MFTGWLSNNASISAACIAVLLIANTATRLHAQVSATLGAGVGYRALQPSLVLQHSEGSSFLTPPPAISPQLTYYLGTRYQFLPFLCAEFRLGGTASSVAAAERRDVLFGISGIPTPGVIRREVSFAYHMVTADLCLQADLGGLYVAEVGVGAGAPMMEPPVIQDAIESPSGVTFVSTGTDRQNVGRGQYFGGVSNVVRATFGVRRHVSIGPSTWLEPFISVGVSSRLQPGSATALPIDATIGLSLTLDGGDGNRVGETRIQQPVPLTRYRVLTDTIGADVVGSGYATDTTWTTTVEVDTSTIDEVGGPISVITTRRITRRVIRQVDPPADIVLSTEIQGLPLRTTAKLVVRFQLVSTEPALCQYAVVVNGDTLERRQIVAFDDTETYNLAELFDRIADADVYSLHIVASGKKLNGLPIASVSETLEVLRSRDRRTLRIER